MKQAIKIMAALVMLVCLLGCKTKKAVIQESSTVLLTDTTKTETDSTGIVERTTDSLAIAASTAETNDIVFVDGGGTVSIDSAGRISLQGVKSIKAGKLSTWQAKRRVEATKQADSVATRQANGIKRDEATQRKEKTKSSTRPAWYTAPLIIVTGGCCLAAMLWLLFMYLKQRL